MANENRKTAAGMQAVGAPPALSVTEGGPSRSPVGGGLAHALGLLMTILVHAAVAALMFLMHTVEEKRPRREEPFQSIEAGLAFKKKATDAPKSKLPQKEDPPPVKPPEEQGIARNPDVAPTPEEKKPKKPEPVDPKNVFDKYRQMDTRSTDKEEVEGADDGSEFGTLERAKGDPYIGELIGRMITEFEVPSVVSDANLKTWGCVKLDEHGRISDRALDPENKSRSHAFNSAVERRLAETTDMDKPVPNHLKKMLVGKFVCATYTSRR